MSMIYDKCLLIKQVYFVSKYGKILFLVYMDISLFVHYKFLVNMEDVMFLYFS